MEAFLNMHTTMSIGDEQKQLIPMSSFTSEKTSTDEDIHIISETNHLPEGPVPTDLKQQTFLLRFFSRISQILRVLHLPHASDDTLRIVFLFFILLIGITSFTTALIIGTSIVQFKQQCPLYASFEFRIFPSRESNWTVKIVPLSERFSSQSTCDFCTFFNVFTFIYCIMTGFFFVLFNGDQRIVTSNDRCLIIPWFPISVILGLFSLINASILTNGFLKFCSTIKTNDSRVTSCTQLNQLHFEQYPNVSSFFIYMLLAIISSWFQLAYFIGIITVLTIRLASSFDWSNTNVRDLKGKSMNVIVQSTEQT